MIERTRNLEAYDNAHDSPLHVSVNICDIEDKRELIDEVFDTFVNQLVEIISCRKRD